MAEVGLLPFARTVVRRVEVFCADSETLRKCSLTLQPHLA